MLDFNILSVNSVEFNYIIIFDIVSLMFMGTVILIAGCVIYYRKDYIHGDPNLERFIWIVFIFVMSMIALIISPNIIRILLGWDGLGLVSYCLVIYYQNIKSFNAGILTALSNRIGDVIILIAIALFSTMGSFNFIAVTALPSTLWVAVTSLVVIAACTKSAQIPFSAWLPAAMAAPTPVSALVHSSTLVTAGVYLLIRFNHPLITFGLYKPLLIISILTILMAGLGATFETDLKKIIALSTLSQLGLMILSIRIGITKIAYFHMLRHALFKALLFICAGNIIHSRIDNQDLRKIGFITMQIPLTRACLNTANLALCGTPFLAGFYSKDMILETLLGENMSHWTLFLAFTATALTLTYSIRLRCYALISNPNRRPLFNLNDSPQFSTSAIVPLSLLSITGGALISWVIFPTPSICFLPPALKLLIFPTLVAGALVSLGIYISAQLLSSPTCTSNLLEFLGSM